MATPLTTLRPVRLPDDLEALWEVAVATEGEVLDEAVTTREEIRATLEGPEADTVDGIRVAVGPDGEILGFVTIEVDGVGREIMLDAYAKPGVGADVLDLLLEHGVGYSRRHAAGLADATGWIIGAGTFADDTAYAQALMDVGFVPVRRFHRMRVELDPAKPVDVPDLPPGVELRVVGEDEAGQRLIHEVIEDAFVDHWRHVPRPWDEWVAFFRNRGYDPSQWWLVTVDGEPAAAAIGNDTVVDLGSGYVTMLGVRKPYRGRGLGRLLLLTAFADAQRRGRTSLRLGVDTENSTGAPALYASVGMTPAEVIDAYELPLA
jgi:ribosomal protein S18 acetylase RimI-like enzyme